ncbi:isochorismatase family protein [uncultured Streptomyces sp.]|uniref:isochorismatase family protein n=1 Tax=uncultured Streptomyces sp. TaxID=174707 RepID=UPI00260FB5D5|nr:isochorismatase family protein [uncultured Streptomyces sp.]
MPGTTLRELNGLPGAPAKLAGSTLLLIDFQNTYTRGVLELEGWESSLDAAARLLARARREGTPVVHVVHDSGAGSLYDVRAESGAIHPRLTPADGEHVVVKEAPDAFVGTDLASRIPEGQDVVIAGWMTHMCVTFTAQGAFLRGNRPTVVAEATATRAVPALGADVEAHHLHRGALATIADLYGVVVATAEDLG